MLLKIEKWAACLDFTSFLKETINIFISGNVALKEPSKIANSCRLTASPASHRVDKLA